MAVFISMFVFALVGAISPGPVNVIANVAGANYGFKRALPHVLGATVAYTLIVLLAGLGLNEILTAKPLEDQADENINPPTFIERALSQLLNPKAWLVSMSGVSLFVTPNMPTMVYLLAFCAISFWVCLFSGGSWAALGHMIPRFLANHKYQIIFNAASGLLLVGTVVSIFTMN